MTQKISRVIKRILLACFALLLVLALTTIFYMRHAKFGAKPAGERLTTIQKSANYKDGKFVNRIPTPNLVNGYTTIGVAYNYFFKKPARRKPVDVIPSLKTDLQNIPIDQDILVWFGHSSYFIQLNGKRILVDPIFSGNASPVAGTVRSFKGTDIYTVDDLPAIDYIFISHDHYDHLDYETVVRLLPKTGKVICGLGVGAHFERWGYAVNDIIERDWNGQIRLDTGFTAYTTPARHFSGRGFATNNTLWLSFILETSRMKIYVGGDSGYDTHFAEIGKKYGPIDLAILDNGQYNVAWRNIHMLPEDVLQAGKDLKAARLFPVHSSKFVLASHPWDEPLAKLSSLNSAEENPIPLMTPIIGELVLLNNPTQTFKQWWLNVE